MADIYFDNSSTTRCLPQAAERMAASLVDNYGNPSSLHGLGIAAEKEVKEARKHLARALKVQNGEIYFTSGGTEANNWAAWGVARQRGGRGRHIVTTAIEHASVINSMRRLEEEGFEVTYLDVDENGLVSTGQLKEALTQHTILVSIMSVNNEVGSVQPIAQLAKVVKSTAPQAVFHVDGVQSFGKLPLYPKELGVDLLSVSAHKIHGPKGVGALYVQRDIQLKPLLVGGEQEFCQRAGTENVAGVVGFGVAAQYAGQKLAAGDRTIILLKEMLLDGLEGLAGVHINGPRLGATAAPHIANIWCEGIDRGEVLLHSLEAEGIYVSTGSACHSRRQDASHVLKNMGVKGEALTGAIRISLSYLNTQDEIKQFVEKLAAIIVELRELS